MTNHEAKSGSIEKPVDHRGAGAIFHIRTTDEFMFFLRDEKDSIPFPGKIDILGGHMEDEDADAKATALRELGEELEYTDTGEPFQPDNLILFKSYIDDRNVEQNVFGCELEQRPDLMLKEGQRLVFLHRNELPSTDFAFDYNQVVLDYAQTV